MTPEPDEFDRGIYLEADARDYKPHPMTAAERRKWLAMLKKHSPGDYAYCLEQQKLRKEAEVDSADLRDLRPIDPREDFVMGVKDFVSMSDLAAKIKPLRPALPREIPAQLKVKAS